MQVSLYRLPVTIAVPLSPVKENAGNQAHFREILTAGVTPSNALRDRPLFNGGLHNLVQFGFPRINGGWTILSGLARRASRSGLSSPGTPLAVHHKRNLQVDATDCMKDSAQVASVGRFRRNRPTAMESRAASTISLGRSNSPAISRYHCRLWPPCPSRSRWR